MYGVQWDSGVKVKENRAILIYIYIYIYITRDMKIEKGCEKLGEGPVKRITFGRLFGVL